MLSNKLDAFNKTILWKLYNEFGFLLRFLQDSLDGTKKRTIPVLWGLSVESGRAGRSGRFLCYGLRSRGIISTAAAQNSWYSSSAMVESCSSPE